jgi:flavin reductase (DIM6/NTAB) family NADH-FMN oxidoreductase RutF/DNA-binding MarR family transcriptional regulator
MSFDPKDFRRALGKFPTGVTVITARDADGEPIGVTASSFNTLSMDPALILWSIDKNAYSLDAFSKGKGFAINVLRHHQLELSNGFARRGEDKFAGVETSDCANGAPLLPDTAAWFACTTWEVYEGGDHVIIVGEVTDYGYSDNVSSLVFHNGRYAVSATHPAGSPPVKSLEAHGFLGDYLLYQLRQTLNAYAADFYPRLGEFGVTVEEWRLLTLLGDGEPMTLEVVSGYVSQPLRALAETGEWLQEKGLITVINNDSFQLTEKGQQLATRMLEMAIEHEQNIFFTLDDSEQEMFKSMLNRIQAVI